MPSIIHIWARSESRARTTRSRRPTPPRRRLCGGTQPRPRATPTTAHVCYTGTTAPICILRASAGAAVVNSCVLNVSILTCSPGQAQGEDPATRIPFCYGVPCGPGYTGVPAYC